MGIYSLTKPDDLTAPVLVAGLEGWVNAGSVATAAATHLVGDGADLVAEFDPDQLFDYRANRPRIDFVEGVTTDLEWPSLRLYRRRLEGRDLLVLAGIEPNWNWQQFGDAVAAIATELGVVEYIAVGGIPSAVPHTRGTSVVSTASRPELISDDQRLPMGLLRVPGAAVSVLEHYLSERGIPGVGFWAQVPHYVANAFVPGTVAVVEQVARHLGVPIPLGSLLDDAAEQRRQLDAILEQRPDAQAFVERLEAIYDAQSDDLPSGEDIAIEIERFLREEAEGGPFGD